MVMYAKAEGYDLFCMGHKIKLAKSVLCVRPFCFLKGNLVGLIDGRNEFWRPPGHMGSLALWKWGKKTKIQPMYTE